MAIEFRCPQCTRLLRTGDETAGKQAKCPQCGTVMQVPDQHTVTAEEIGAPSGPAGAFGQPEAGSPFQPSAGHPASPYPLRPSVPNYLVQAILCTLFCCLPFGIVAIVYAAQVDGKLSAGDYRGATTASDSARTWCWVSFGLGFVPMLLWFLFMSAGVAFHR